jgi:hypothetical protein
MCGFCILVEWALSALSLRLEVDLLLEDAVDLLDLEPDDECFETDGNLPSLLLELIRIMLLFNNSGSNILSSFVLVTSWLSSGY